MEKKQLQKKVKKKSKKQLQKRSGKQLKKETKQKRKQKKEKPPDPVKKFSFMMKDVRCFAGEQKFEIPPFNISDWRKQYRKNHCFGMF